MKLYLASSWKNETMVLDMAKLFRIYDHQVDAFCDPSKGRFVFNYEDLNGIENMNAQNALQNQLVQKAFKEDQKWIDWADGVILILPAGRSAHLEAGYAVGQGKFLIIYQDHFPNGEFDVMYGFADLVTSNLDEIIVFLAAQDHLDNQFPDILKECHSTIIGAANELAIRTAAKDDNYGFRMVTQIMDAAVVASHCIGLQQVNEDSPLREMPWYQQAMKWYEKHQKQLAVQTNEGR